MDESASPAPVEDRIRSGLADLASTAPDPTLRRAGVEGRIAGYERQVIRRRQLLVGAAATTAVAGAGLTWLLAGQGSAPEQTVTAGPSTTTGSPSTTGGPTSATGWQRIAVAPLSARRAPLVVWAGDRLVVWGGTIGLDALPPDGASWNPASAAWAMMARGRAGVIAPGFALWNGAEVVVGTTEADFLAPWNRNVTVSDARYGIAAYAPATNAWRYVAPEFDRNPWPVPRGRQAVVVRDGVLVAVRTAVPGEVDHGRDVMVLDVTTGDHRALDPGPFAASPYTDWSGQVALATEGDLVVATPNWDRRPWVLDPRAGVWRHASAPPESGSLHLLAATAVGAEVVFSEGHTSRLAWALDPRFEGDDAWRALAPNPFRPARWGYDPVWNGRELFVPGAAYDLSADRWREVPAPPRGENRQREGMQACWTGDSLLLFGGEEYSCGDNATCDRSPGPDTLDGWRITDP
jgi:hypothetical protein